MAGLGGGVDGARGDRQTPWVLNCTTLEVTVNGGKKMCCESEGDF